MTREMIIKGLKERGYNAEAIESVKNGVVMEGISIRTNKEISPIIYTSDMVSYAKKHELSVAWVVDEILDIYNAQKDFDFDHELFFNRNFLSQNVYVGFQKTSTEDILRRESEFAGIEMYLFVKGDGWSVKVHPFILKQASILEDTLWECAIINTIKESQMESMLKTICELQNIPYREDMDEDNPMYILTNKDKFRGASAILNKQLLVEFADKHHTHKLVVIPSSIHETLIMPYTNELSIDDLKNFVANVNLTAVDPTERLTDEVYIIEV